ncbi:hypothetical protein BDV97DRAFT_392510 [Delphinella strobiligena]|nr:hypothetical protein BDV97DRAFT_392510 [Delphinella strobiligena]
MYDGEVYWGFSGSPGVGSILQSSYSDIFTDVFTFTGPQDGSASGYFFHMTTGLCLTMTAASTDSFADDYNGTLQLQTCATTATPPEVQSFYDRYECLSAGTDGTYSMDYRITFGATDVTLTQNSGYCFTIDAGDGP